MIPIGSRNCPISIVGKSGSKLKKVRREMKFQRDNK
jgi:hypothetical protein